jgi:hypothetical protein
MSATRNLEKYQKAHDLAQQLLAGPNHIVILASPVFDMPGQFNAMPVKTEVGKVEEVDAIIIGPKSD